ncbi:DUF6531 domain-containing protein [Microbulbifer sp. SAOS-129_SWC]|uniref:DUF6531 domain-containing protein n=1 Tax=Microbulbifer sp. SAOS-129_SWC TaxID=3145235 RepID=UPI0032174E62
MPITLVGGNELGLLDSSYALLNDNKKANNNEVGADENLFVNVSNGNLVIQHQDAYLPSLGDDFQLVRTYNVRGAASDAHGHEDARWSFSTGIRLNVVAGGQSIDVHYGDGSLFDYYWDDNRQLYVSVDGAGAYETIRDLGAIGNTDPAFELTRADQTKLTFSKQGELLSWEDPNGVRMDYVYESDRLVQVKDDTGHEINYLYQNGALYQVTDETGGVLVEYHYESGRLVEVVDRMGHSTKYHYTNDGYIDRIELPYEQDADGDGVAETYEQRQISITYETVNWRGDTKATSQAVTSITDAEGGVTTFDYDFHFQTNGEGQGHTQGDKISKGKGHRVDNTVDSTSVTYSSKFFDGGSTSVVDALGNARAYSNDQEYVDWRVANGYYATYDAALASTDTSYQAQVDNIRQGHSLEYTYLSNGYITDIADQDGYHATYEYDDNGDLVAMTDRNAWGATQSDSDYYRKLRADLGYVDASGNGKLVSELTQAEKDALTELYTAHFAYDSNGNLLTLADNDGSETRFTYTSFNKIASRTSAEGVALTVSDDAQSQQLRQDLGYAALVADLSAEDIQALLDLYTTFYEYDGNQNLIEERSPGGDLTRYTYDAYGNRTQRTVFLDASDTLDPAKQQVTQYFYDALGNNIETIDAEGNHTFAEYDHFGNLVRLTDGNGGVTTYTYDQDNRLLTVSDPEGHTTVNTYDAVGNRISVTDAKGNTVYRFFDKNNRLIRTMDQSSVDPAQDRITQFSYDVLGDRTSATDAEGRTTDYVYNARRELVEAITAAVAGPDGASTQYTTRYRYDGEGNRIAVTNHRGYTTEILYNADGLVSQRTDANGHITRYTYDANNNQIVVVAGLQLPVSQRQVLKYRYDEEDQLEEQTDAEGYTTKFRRDAVGNIIARVNANGIQLGNEEAYTTRFEFDKNNRMVREIMPEVVDPDTNQPVQYTIEHHFDANGNEVKMVDGNGHAINYAYDLDNQLVMVTDANGINTAYRYDANHNRTRIEIGVEVDANGAVTSRDQAQITRYTYDEFNQLVAKTDGLGNALVESNDARYQQMRTGLGYAADATLLSATDKAALRALYTEHYTYDRVGNQLTRTDHEDRVTTFDYDTLNRLVTTTDASGSTITSKYDGNGNLVERKDQNGNITTYAYDALDRQTDTTNAIGTVTHNDYDDFGNVTRTTEAYGTADARETQFVYNLNNWLVNRVDPESHTVSYTYDAVGNRLQVVDGRNNVTQTFYDALNRVISVIDAESFETKFEYDGANNRVAIIDARGGITRFDYDGGNRQIAMTDAEGRVTQYAYDVRGNRIEMRTAAGTADEEVTVFAYDAENNLRSVTDAEGNTTTNNYDRVYNRTSTIDGNGHETISAFDALNRLVNVTNAEGETTSYTYDAGGNRLTTTDALGRVTSWAYDTVNRVTTQTNAQGVETTFTYDAVDNRTSVTMAANTAQAATTVYEYDKDDRLIREQNALGGEKLYSYDPNDNRTAVTDENGNTTVYTYDANNRVTDIQDPKGGVTHYTYDGNGNRTQVTDPRGNAITSYFNADNEVVLEVDAEGYATSRVYDNNGNVVSQTLHMTAVGAVTPETEPTVTAAADDQTVTFGYDQVNRVTSRVDGEGNTATYTYDGVGNQLTITDGNGNTTVNTYDMVNRLATVTNAEDETTVYTYDLVGNRASMVDGNGHITTYTYDELNRMVTETNAENETTRYDYDAVGNRIGMTDALQRETHWEYDLNNRMVKQVNADLVETTYAYDEAGNRTSVTAAANTAQAATTSYAYDGNNRVTDMTDAEGVVTHYVLDANGNVTEQHRAYGTAEVRVSLTTFDKNNRATQVQDPEGGVREYRYDAADNRVEVIDARGNVTTNYFDRANRGVATVDAEGYLTERSFDGVGNVTSQTLYAAPVSGVDPSVVPTPVVDPAQDQTVTFEYDMVDRLTARTDGEGNRTSYTYDEVGNQLTVTDGNGNTTVNTYDMVDRLLTTSNAEGETTAYTYDDVGNRLTMVDANNHTTTYEYDLLNQLVAETNAENETTRYDYDAVGNRISLIDARQNETRWEYDLDNRVTKEIDADLVETTYAYDEVGNRTSATAAANTAQAATTSYAYDGNNRVTDMTDAEGVVTHYVLDANGNVTEQHRAYGTAEVRVSLTTFDKNNRATQVQDPEGGVREYRYDAADNRVEVIDARGNVTTNYFDRANRGVATVDAEGYLTERSFDGVGNVTSQTLYAAPVSGVDPSVVPTPVVDPAQDQTVNFEYDMVDRLTARTDGEGNRTSYTYDEVGNQLTVTDGNGNTTVNTYDMVDRLLTTSNAEGETTAYTYDDVGNRLTMVDANNHTTTYEYDLLNQLVAETNAENETTRYDYDAVGNRISLIDARQNETRWEYDLDNRVTKEINADLVETTYTYDKVGNRTGMIVAANTALAQTTAYSYDLNNRLLSSTDALQRTTSYDYDANGNRVSMTDARGNTVVSYFDKTNQQTAEVDALGYVTTWSYDAAGNRVGQTLFMAPVVGADPSVPPAPVAGADDQLVVFEFDRANRMTAQVNGEGDRSEYTYDGVGNQVTVTDGNGNTTSNTYDAANRLLTSTNAEGETTTYAYDEVGNRVGIVDGNGHGTSYEYDQINRLVTVTNAENEVTRYGYDAVGNRISETDALLRETTWEYDALNRLTRETAADLVETTYAYDEVDNRTSMTVAANTADAATTTYTYDDNNQLRSETNALNQTVSYDYDANGNRTAVTDARQNTTTYTFDKNNRVTQVTDPELSSVEYHYDAADNQVEMIDGRGNVTTNYFDRANRQVASVDAEGFLVAHEFDGVGNMVSETRYMTALTSVDPSAQPVAAPSADDQTVTFEYDMADRLTVRTSGEGFRTEYAYDDVGNRTSVVQYRDQAGTDAAETRFFYDMADRQTAQLSPEGYLTETVYDDVGNMKSVTLYNERASVINGVPQAQAGDTGRTTRYDYDAINQLVSETSALDVVTAYEYDERGNRTAVIEAQGTPDERSTLYSYDTANRVTDIQDAEGVVTHYVLDESGNVKEEHAAYGTADVRVTFNDYDGNNRLIQSKDPLAVISTFAYDGNGNLSSQTVAVGSAEARTESFEYDKNNRQTARINGELERTEFTYDGAGNRTAVTVAPGLPEEQSTHYEYDLDNRQVALVDGEQMRVEYVYDGTGNKLETIQAVGVPGVERHTYYDYDLEGRITRVQDPMGGITQYEYDVLGNQTRILDANGGEQVNTFDQLGRMLTSLSAGGTLTVNSYDQRGNILSTTQSFADGSDARTSTYAYDLLDRQTAVTDGEGYTTSIEYDAFGNQTQVTVGQYLVDATAPDYDADKAARAHVQSSSFSYDAADRMLSMTDGEGNITRYAYNAVGNRTSMTEAANGLHDTPPRTTLYSYDKANRQTRVETPAGGVSVYDYDQAGNKTAEHLLQSVDGSGVETWTATDYEYDGNGRMTAMVDDYGTRTEYEYDAMGNQTGVISAAGTADERAVHMEYDLNNRKTADIDGEQHRTDYQYDAMGNRTKTIDALGRVARYYFDGANRLTAILDPLGNLNTFAYDSAGNQTEAYLYADRYTGAVDDFTAPAGTPSTADRITHTDYDRANHALTVTEADGSVTEKSYDGAGNLLQEVLYANTSDPRTRSYQYDLDNRLVHFTDVDGTETLFAWDGANNKTGEQIVSATDPNAVRETVYVYDLNNRQVQQIFDPNGLNLVQTTAYDKLGNVVTQTDANGNSLHYQYDFNNRATSETNDLGESTHYTYDKVGNVKTLQDPRGVVTEYEYDGNNRVTRELGANVQVYTIGMADPEQSPVYQRLEITHAYDAFGNEVQTTDAAGYSTTRYFDANGRQVAELSADNVLTEWSYNTFGEKASATQYMSRLSSADHDPLVRPAPNGEARTTDMEYDRMGRLTRTVYPQVELTSVDASSGQPVASTAQVRPEETTVYDAFGNAIEITDKNGNTTYAWYDHKGRLEAQVDPAGYLVEWEYDAQDNVLEQRVYTQPLDTASISSATRPNPPAGDVYTVSKVYDAANRVTEERSPLVDVVDNSGGDPVQERVLTLYTYDGNGNETSRTVAAGTSQAATEYSYYDAAGRRVALINSDRVLHTFIYDENGNLTQRKRYFNTVDAGAIAGLTGDSDFASLVATSADDQATAFAFDNANRQTSETDLMDGTDASDDITQSYVYNARGEQTWAKDGDGFVTEIGYDGAGRVIKNIAPDGTGSTIQYDAAGNQTLMYTGEIDSVAQSVDSQGIKASFGDMLQLSWDMPDGIEQQSWVVWSSSSHADLGDNLDAYENQSAKLGTWFSNADPDNKVRPEIYIPSESFSAGEGLYFRIVTADRAGNLAWSAEQQLQVPPTLGAVDVTRVDADTTIITVDAGSNAQNLVLNYGATGSTGNQLAMTDNGDGTWSVTIDGVSNLNEQSYLIGWQDSDGNSYQSTEKTFVASDTHVGVSTQLGQTSVVNGSETDYIINLDTRVPAEVAGQFATVVASWTDANGVSGEVAVEGVDNGDGTWSYALNLGSASSPLAAGSYTITLEGTYAQATSFGAQGLILDQFQADVSATDPLAGSRQGLSWQAPTMGDGVQSQLVLVDGQLVASSRDDAASGAGGQLIVSTELTPGGHSYNALYGETVVTDNPHSLDVTSTEVTEEVDDPDNPGSTITNVLGYDQDFSLTLDPAEAANVNGDLTLSWRTAGSGLDFANSAVMSYDGSQYSATLAQLQEGDYDVKLSYTDADGNEVIVQWLRLDSAQVTGGGSKNYQGSSLTVLGSETGGSLNVAADGQIGFSTGLYSGPGSDARNFVNAVVSDSGPSAGSRTTDGVTAGYYTESHYNALNQLVATNQGSGVWRHYGVDANGNHVATYTSGTEGEDLASATEVHDSYAEFDGRNRMTTEYSVAADVYGESGPVRAKTDYAYDVQDHQVSITDARGYSTTRGFNALGMMTWENDNRSGVTQHFYDRLGRETRTIDQLNNETSKRYDLGGRLIEEINGAGDITRYDYDAFGRRTSQTLVDTITGKGERSTSFVYDQRDRLLTQTDAGGETLEFQYDNRDNRTASRDIAGDWTYQTFDSLNRVVETRYEGVNGWVNETRQYDSYGNLVAEKDAAGRITTHEYGAFGRKIATVDQGNQKTVYEYDDFGNQVREYHPVSTSYGNTALWNYNLAHEDTFYAWKFSQTLRELDYLYPTSSGTGTSTQGIIRSYDAAGHLTSVTDEITGVSTSYEYDVMGNRMHEVISGTGGHDRNITYDYDEAGQLSRWHDGVTGQNLNYLWDAAGNQKRVYTDVGYSGEAVNHWYDYDGANRITEMRNGEAGNIISQFTYDGLGQRAKWTDKGTDVFYSYDLSGRVTLATWTEDGASWKSTWHYDADGNVDRFETWKGGSKESYNYTTYSANGISTWSDSDDQVTESTYDDGGRLLKMKLKSDDATYTYTYYYHADGREQKIVGKGDANGTSTYTYNANHQLTKLDKGKGDNEDRREYLTFVYNNDGQILYRKHDEGTDSDISDTEFQYANGQAVGEKKTWHNGDATEEQLDTGDYNLIPNIGEDYPSSAVTSVTAVEGDSLQSIAARVYGNPSLWFVLADANGLDPSQPLKGGVKITVPNSVETGRIDANTHKLYNEGDIIGSALPNLKTPDSDSGCGNILMIIIVVVIAVVATIATAGLASALLPAVGGTFLGLSGTAATLAAWAVAGAVVGAAASIVQQGLFIALGYQESFSWKEVAAGAVAGAFSGAAQGVGAAVKAGQIAAKSVKYAKTAAAALKAAGAASKQLISAGKITSWSSVAAAALGPTQNKSAGIDMEGFLDASTVQMVTPWLNAAETYIREGELTTADWVNAVGQTVGAAVGDGKNQFEILDGGIQDQLLIGGAMSLVDKRTGQDYINNAIGNEIGQAIAADLTSPGSQEGLIAKAKRAGAAIGDFFSGPEPAYAGINSGLNGTFNNGFNDNLLNHPFADNLSLDPGDPLALKSGPALLEESSGPQIYTFQSGDNPSSIARDILGPEASEREIQLYAERMLSINPELQGNNTRGIQIGTEVVLPTGDESISAAASNTYGGDVAVTELNKIASGAEGALVNPDGTINTDAALAMSKNFANAGLNFDLRVNRSGGERLLGQFATNGSADGNDYLFKGDVVQHLEKLGISFNNNDREFGRSWNSLEHVQKELLSTPQDSFEFPLQPTAAAPKQEEGIWGSLKATWDDVAGVAKDYHDVVAANTLILAGGVGGALGFDEFRDNAFGAANYLFDSPAESSLKGFFSGSSGVTMGAAQSVGEGVLGALQLTKMAVLEKTYDTLGGETGLQTIEGFAKKLGTDEIMGFSPYDMMRENHQQVEQLKTSISDGVSGFISAPGEKISAGWDSLVSGAKEYGDNLTTMFTAEQNSQIYFSGTKVGKTTMDVGGVVAGGYGVVKGGVKLTAGMIARRSASLADEAALLANDVTRLGDDVANQSVDFVWHTSDEARKIQGVLDGIDPKYLNPESRFGPAFYVGEQPTTTVAELAHHGVDAKYSIRFDLNKDAMNVLDLTDPNVAKAWDYKGGPISSATQEIGLKAQEQGFNVIRFNSERATNGINNAVLDNFNEILKPINVSPVKK